MNDRAIAWQTSAVSIPRHHLDSVLLTTVQVVPGAGAGICDTLVVVAIKSCCHSKVCLIYIAGGPTNQTNTGVTFRIGHHCHGHTGTQGFGEGCEQDFNNLIMISGKLA